MGTIDEDVITVPVSCHSVDIGPDARAVIIGSAALQPPQEVELQIARLEDVRTRQGRDLMRFVGVDQHRRDQDDELLLARGGDVLGEEAADDG
jgi:hypothetical protein